MLKLSPKQNEYIVNANHRWNLKVGAVRSGKSFVDVAFIIPYRLRMLAGKTGLAVILGVSKESIERNVLEPMREIYTDALVGQINGRNLARICGQDVYCLGAEKKSQVAKIQGSSIKYCYGDEIAKWSPDVFEMLKSRLDKPYSCFDGACNPEYPGHWLKKFIDDKEIDSYIQHYVIFDNPFLPKNYIDSICKEYAGTVYYDRYIQGRWALAEGLIYPMYQNAICEVPNNTGQKYALSIDYGTQNAFAAYLWKQVGGVWYAYKEYYYSGRDKGIQKTDEEYGKDLDEFVRDVPLERGQKLLTIIDPSAASFIALLKKRGWAKVQKANNDVADGIRETATALKTGLIKISPNLKHWREEAEGYAWDEKAGTDTPIKINDHAMDSMRYLVKTLHIAKPKRQGVMTL